MKIHEYQAKMIFKDFGIPVPEGEVASTPNEAYNIAKRLSKPVVVKAQVLVGGRGKAGGIKFANTPNEAKKVASEVLRMKIKGIKVNKVLVAESIDIENEAYMGIIIDRSKKSPVVMVSSEGGVDIEEVSKKSPEKVIKFYVDPMIGILSHRARELCFKIYDDPKIAIKAGVVLSKLYRCFIESDASLAEINPFVVTKEKDIWALDAKMNIDDNGLYRRPTTAQMRDLSYEIPGEIEARNKGLSYIKLDGNIGCIVNGAGLAMATMDLIKLYGGEPANFLDIGGSSSPTKVTNAMSILLSDKNVKAVFFNIFGGITRCDDVANGIVTSLNKMKVNLPIVIRLTGTNEDKAMEILKKTKLITASSMAEGAKRAIELAGR